MLASRLCTRVVFRSRAIPSGNLTAACTSIAWRTKRVFATTPQHRKEDVARIGTVQQEAAARQPVEESVKPENVKKEKPAEPTSAKPDPLLAEQTVSNKEQRKADWAIIKNMAHYLWPKDDFGTRFRVGLSVALLVGAKVRLPNLFSVNLGIDRLRRSSMSKFHSISNLSSTA
jgi:ATP-binding cassette, subfamily B (MDR/TAP), member 7